AAAVHAAHALHVDPGGGDLLSDPRIAGLTAGASERRQIFQGDALEHLLLEGEPRAALVRERRHGDLPAPIDVADDVGTRDGYGVEEHLAEFGGSGDLPERPDRDAGKLHVEDEVGQAPVLRQRRIGARQEAAPAGELCVARPHLLPGDTEAVAVALRARAHRGEVAARVRLAEELAPDLVAGEDRGKEATLQLLAAVRDERRTGVVDA